MDPKAPLSLREARAQEATTEFEFDFNISKVTRPESLNGRSLRLGEKKDHNIYKDKKMVLFWTTLYFNPGLNYSNKVFKNAENCPVTSNCEVTSDRTMLAYSHAVLFHFYDLKDTVDVPEYHHPKQKWVFLNEEPPTLTEHVQSYNNTFNITMTYRRDSDVYDPYGYLVQKTPLEQMAYLRNGTRNFARGKTKMAAWFVSSCNAKSKRQDYVKELQKYIDIEIYGECGDFKCEKGNPECYEKLQNDYKFYLSFENSLCKDYVTEKLWRVMQYDVIPVVLGGASYSEYLPAKSYIDVSRFPSPMALGKYLLQLDYNDAMYNQYFVWKRTYKVITKSWLQRFCNLCQFLHETEGQEKTHQDLPQWWDQCIEPKVYYRKSAPQIARKYQ